MKMKGLLLILVILLNIIPYGVTGMKNKIKNTPAIKRYSLKPHPAPLKQRKPITIKKQTPNQQTLKSPTSIQKAANALRTCAKKFRSAGRKCERGGALAVIPIGIAGAVVAKKQLNIEGEGAKALAITAAALAAGNAAAGAGRGAQVLLNGAANCLDCIASKLENREPPKIRRTASQMVR